MKRLTYPLRAGAALAAVLLTQLMAVVAAAQQSGQVPGQALGNASDADLWRAIRQGAGNLIQAEGSTWRALHNGPLSTYGIWIMAGMVFLLALFFLLPGSTNAKQPCFSAPAPTPSACKYPNSKSFIAPCLAIGSA